MHMYAGSNKAVSVCYDRGNVQGDVTGNCGQSSTGYLPCSARHVPIVPYIYL